MKRKEGILVIVVAALIVLVPALCAAQHTVDRAVIGAGGGVSSGGGYTMNATAGQPAVGETAGAGNTVRLGLWHTSWNFLTGIDDTAKGTPAHYELMQNHPNPFNPSTTIRYAITTGSHVRIDVFNVRGQRVATLVDEYQEAGHHNVRFDATAWASGIYLYRIRAGQFTATKKMVLLK